MRILFMGTPDIAAECLKALYAAGHEICGVYTRRDKPVGRKQGWNTGVPCSRATSLTGGAVSTCLRPTGLSRRVYTPQIS